MKKVFCIGLVLIFCLTLCACGGNMTTIDKQLQGDWEPIGGNGGYYTFDNGRFSCYFYASGVKLETKEGSYEITENYICIKYDNGVNSELKYTFENGELLIEDLYKK